MSHDMWTDRLSEYLDGGLDAAEASALERHLGECPSCAQALAELRAVVSAAASLGGLPPERDLWPGIEARLGGARAPVAPGVAVDGRGGPPGRSRRGFFLSLPQLAAAAVLLMTVTGGVTSLTWLALSARRGGGEAPGGAIVTGPGAAAIPATPASLEEVQASAAIAELESLFTTNRERLAPETVRVIESNLAVINDALEQARAALAADPGSAYLNMHFADTLRRKVQFLREAGTLVAMTL